MTYTDANTKETVTKVMENQEWLCDSKLKANDVYQVKTCMLSKCSFHTQWSAWSTCNKLCDGFRSRSRSCSLNDYSNENLRKLCTDVYLKNVEVCGLSNCKSLVSTLVPEQPTTSDIIKRGILRFMNVVTSKIIKIFTNSNAESNLTPIGQVACRELGFDGFSGARAVDFSHMRGELNDADYLTFINQQNLNGLKCKGDEKTLKECESKIVADLATPVFEMDIECICEFL